MHPRFVYFDLDDTLLDHRSAESGALSDLTFGLLQPGGCNVAADQIQTHYHDQNRLLWRLYSEGQIDKMTLRQRRFEHLIREFGLHRWSWAELESFYFDSYRGHWREIAGAREAYFRIADAYPVGLITNGFADIQRAKLSRFPFIEDRARAIIISEEVGFLKPDPKLFAIAEEAAGEKGESILYVGDSYRSDVLGALAAGWTSAWYTDGTAVVDGEVPDEVFSFNDWSLLLAEIGA